jgi:hypothetical protein
MTAGHQGCYFKTDKVRFPEFIDFVRDGWTNPSSNTQKLILQFATFGFLLEKRPSV